MFSLRFCGQCPLSEAKAEAQLKSRPLNSSQRRSKSSQFSSRGQKKTPAPAEYSSHCCLAAVLCKSPLDREHCSVRGAEHFCLNVRSLARNNDRHSEKDPSIISHFRALNFIRLNERACSLHGKDTMTNKCVTCTC